MAARLMTDGHSAPPWLLSGLSCIRISRSLFRTTIAAEVTYQAPAMSNEHKYEQAPVAVPVFEGVNVQRSDDDPSAEARLVVVAPATLPAGYTFDADAGGRTFRVQVPEGGVEEGQEFSVPYPPDEPTASMLGMRPQGLEQGRWKDDLCDCCRFGPCHPVIGNAICFSMILVAQLLHRLDLTWLGEEGRGSANTFGILLRLYLLFIAITFILQFLQISSVTVDAYGRATPSDVGPIYALVRGLISFAFSLFTLVLMCKARKHIRDRDNIPEKQCHGCEDCCCVYWCSCCTLTQMARHTADYETYAARCCSDTGLSPNAPVNVGTEMRVPANSIV